jgi:CRISPR-associated endonuclease/helicase Cas3
MAHRKKVLNEMMEALKRGKKTLCVSTQVIEAGVDIS